MKNLFLTKTRWLVTIILLTALGIGNAWGAEGDTHDFAQSISALLNRCNVPDDIEISDPGYPVKEVIITYTYNKSAPATANVTIDGDDWGTGVSLTSGGSPASISDDAASGDIVISFTANASCSGTGKGTLAITNVRLVEGSSGGGCTSGVVSSIKAGDVVLMYYSTYELSGIASSGDSYWGDYTTCGATPSGAYPLTVEAGSSSGTWAFKNGNNYLAVTSDANMLTTSTTKNANSSWTVSISSGNATITNSAYSSRIIRFNSSTNRFSTYTGTPSGMYLVKLYKYCGDVKYHVTYYGNDNTGGSVPTDNNEYTSSQSATVIGNTGSLVRTGCAWVGWNTKADGSGTTYTAGNSISMSGGSVSLYAKWTCTVTWSANNTTFSTTSNVVCGSSVSAPSPAPDEDDYCGDKFVGWTTDTDYTHGTSPLFTTTSPTITGATTFYAVFADYAN